MNIIHIININHIKYIINRLFSTVCHSEEHMYDIFDKLADACIKSDIKCTVHCRKL